MLMQHSKGVNSTNESMLLLSDNIGGYTQGYESMIYANEANNPDNSLLSGNTNFGQRHSNHESLKNMHKAINNSVIIDGEHQAKKKKSNPIP